MASYDRAARWGGAALMVGSLLFLVNKVDEMSRVFLHRWMPDMISGDDSAILLLGQVLLVGGYLGFYRVFAGRGGRLPRNALRLFCVGGVILAVGHLSFVSGPAVGIDFEPMFLLVILGLAAMLLGLILYGVANLRRPMIARWPWLPLATGLAGFVGFFLLSGEPITAAFLTFRTLFALGLLGLGLTLFLEKLAPAESPKELRS